MKSYTGNDSRFVSIHARQIGLASNGRRACANTEYILALAHLLRVRDSTFPLDRVCTHTVSLAPMKKETAYSLGVDSGLEAARYGEFSNDVLLDEDSFTAECSEICDNKRQYADSPTYDFAREPNSDSLFYAFDEGETVGIGKGWRERAGERKKLEAQRELSEAIDAQARGEFDGLAVSDLSEVPTGFRGMVLHVNDHGNATLYVKTARKFREIASRV